MKHIICILLICTTAFCAMADEVTFATSEELSAFDKLVVKQQQKSGSKKLLESTSANVQSAIRAEQDKTQVGKSSAKNNLIKTKKSENAAVRGGNSHSKKSKK